MICRAATTAPTSGALLVTGQISMTMMPRLMVLVDHPFAAAHQFHAHPPNTDFSFVDPFCQRLDPPGRAASVAPVRGGPA